MIHLGLAEINISAGAPASICRAIMALAANDRRGFRLFVLEDVDHFSVSCCITFVRLAAAKIVSGFSWLALAAVERAAVRKIKPRDICRNSLKLVSIGFCEAQ